MSTFALNAPASSFARISPPGAGGEANRLRKVADQAFGSRTTTALSGSVFSDLRALAKENGIVFSADPAFQMAERFLLALPSSIPSPELDLDHDGEVVFDWGRADGRMMTLSLRGDGRLSYARRASAMDKDHGTKNFNGEIPRPIFEMVKEITK